MGLRKQKKITFADIEEKTKITTNETEDKTQQGNEITQTIKSNPERENSEFEKNVSQKNTVQSIQNLKQMKWKRKLTEVS
ncbi:hypothetical protein ABPG74_014115 [Tetrahymena malaccensis]